MSHQTCTFCAEPIPTGEAVIRTRNFEHRAWHRDCFDADHAEVPAAVEIPAQRVSDERVTA